LFWRFPEAFLPHFGLELPYALFEERDEVLRALDAFADEGSRAQYVAELVGRLDVDDHDPLPARPPGGLNFAEDLFALGDDDVLVDCGAFDGDTVREVVRRRGAAFRRLFALEPDPTNFAKLEHCVASFDADVRRRIVTRRVAVGARAATLRFRASGSMLSAVSAIGELEVEAIRLDELLADEAPTYLKMDIEGGEADALEGARRTIERARPVLAIAIEHRLDDLWRIPLQLRTFGEGYSLFLRRYAEEILESVCYAVPHERLV
jgi:FkbM family methyltransferase